MSAKSSQYFLLMGLPNTGKTSFLAALWYLVQHPQVVCKFRLEKLEGDNKYLNQISQAWVEYTPVPHTRIDSETLVSMLLKNETTGQKLTLFFPDLSGESFRLQWTARQFTKGYDKLLQQASGAMLFVNPAGVIKPIRIDMADPLIDEMAVEHEKPAQVISPAPNPWDADRSPTQVQLVELLQILSSRDYFEPPFRLAIIVSAWDVLARLEHSPQDWLREQLPLLHQFLQSNSHIFDSTVFGISAQGVDYSAAQNITFQRGKPAERIQVVGTSVINLHDLTEPLQWLML